MGTGFSLDPEAKAIASASSSQRETGWAKASEIFPVTEWNTIQTKEAKYSLCSKNKNDTSALILPYLSRFAYESCDPRPALIGYNLIHGFTQRFLRFRRRCLLISTAVPIIISVQLATHAYTSCKLSAIFFFMNINWRWLTAKPIGETLPPSWLRQWRRVWHWLYTAIVWHIAWLVRRTVRAYVSIVR